MSRIGKKPVEITSGVEVTLAGRDITAKGSKGTLNWTVPHEVEVKQEESTLVFTPCGNTKDTAAKWGLSRAMVANMIQGVSEGFQKTLTIKGVGYRAAVQGKVLNLALGYSHPVNMDIPEGLTVTTPEPTTVIVAGADKQVVGQFASEVRAKRPPEPYKGKGVRYSDEHVIMKEGKKK